MKRRTGWDTTPGTCRHIKAALYLGATMEQIMEVLKVCVAQGASTCSIGAPILAEELEMLERRTNSDQCDATKI